MHSINMGAYIVQIFGFPSSRFGENLEHALPSLTELILTSNNIQELVGDPYFHHNINMTSFMLAHFGVICLFNEYVKLEPSF